MARLGNGGEIRKRFSNRAASWFDIVLRAALIPTMYEFISTAYYETDLSESESHGLSNGLDVLISGFDVEPSRL